MLAVDDRVVMVSGANRGIGRALAAGLLAKGYRLSLGARRPESLADLAGEGAGERVLAAAYDALDPVSAAAWVEATLARFGRIDALINNAGALRHATVEDGRDEDFEHLWQVNAMGPLRLTRLALPHLKRSGSARIVNVVSLSGKRVRGDNAGYAMSKFAALALTHATRRAGWRDGVRVTALCPAWVATDMASHAEVPAVEMIQPDDLCELVATVLALPNNASIAELLVNCRFEDTL
jgi:NAD(P)-dependent dehydrogenase (short-subunit alcohol dehydrogenase family)